MWKNGEIAVEFVYKKNYGSYGIKRKWLNRNFVEEEKIIIEKIHKIPNLQERLESFYQKTLDQIGHIDSEEANTGDPKGNEIS